MKITHIFFDFDGVLAESVNIKTEAFRQMYLPYGVKFAQKVVNHHIANGGMSRFEKFKVYNGTWLGEIITENKITELANQFSKLVVDGVVNAPEVKGAYDFLKSSTSYKKYIITGTPTVEIKPILKRRNILNYFEGVFGSPEKKDYWIKQILKNEKLDASQCVFIGDALADFKAATSNKITFILRETEVAKHLFNFFKEVRIKDIISLGSVLENINSKY